MKEKLFVNAGFSLPRRLNGFALGRDLTSFGFARLGGVMKQAGTGEIRGKHFVDDVVHIAF